MDYDERKAAGDVGEMSFAEVMKEQHWVTTPFGQDTWNGVQKIVKFMPLRNLRCLPDLLAAREFFLGGETVRRAAFFDSKTGRSDTPNYCVNRDSAHAMFDYQTLFRMPCVFVTADLRVIDPSWVLRFGVPGKPGPNNGSGDPHYLIDKAYSVPLWDAIHPGSKLWTPFGLDLPDRPAGPT